MDEEQYRRAIDHQRSLGQAYVGTRLDSLCARLGLDPSIAWRLPKWREEEARRWRIPFNVYNRVAVSRDLLLVDAGPFDFNAA